MDDTKKSQYLILPLLQECTRTKQKKKIVVTRFLMVVILRWVNYRPDEGKLKDILIVQIYSSWQNPVMFMLEYPPN